MEVAPEQTPDAVGVNPLTTGFVFTLNTEVLPEDTALEQPDAVFATAVTVTVVEPVVPSSPVGMVKFPLPPTVVNDAVFPEEIFAPVRL